MRFSSGKTWWFPLDSEDHVRVTEDVMSYELNGELRLAESMGTVERVELATEDPSSVRPRVAT